MKAIFTRLWRDESGVTAVEYGLIAGLVAALLVAVVGIFGEQLEALFRAIADKLGDAANDIQNPNTNP